MDIRNGRSLDEMASVLENLKASGVAYQILYLEASDEVLVKRYKETRRAHPLAKQGRVEDGIRLEREKLLYLKENATYILDTSQLLTRELKKALEQILVEEKNFKNLMITVLSFGFKYGIPNDCDLVLMFVFCRIPTMWTDSNTRRETMRRFRISLWTTRSPISSWTSSWTC